MTNAATDQSTRLDARSPFLGVGILVSIVGITTIFGDGPSLEYKVGHVVGQVLASLLLALPLLLIWRYFTDRGRKQTFASAFNAFVAGGALLWAILFLAGPSMLSSVTKKADSDRRAAIVERVQLKVSETCPPQTRGVPLNVIRPFYPGYSDAELSDATAATCYPDEKKSVLQKELGFWPGMQLSD